MDHSEHGENKHKIFKYTDKDGHVHYVDENGNPVKKTKTAFFRRKSFRQPFFSQTSLIGQKRTFRKAEYSRKTGEKTS